MALSPLQDLPPSVGIVDQRQLPFHRITVGVMPNDSQRRLVLQEPLPLDIAAPAAWAGATWGRMAVHEYVQAPFRPGPHDVVELVSGLPAMVLEVRVFPVSLRVTAETWVSYHNDITGARASEVTREADLEAITPASASCLAT